MAEVALWLRIGDDDAAARVVAQEFAATVPDKQRPNAAMLLTRAGFSDLADALFEPRREVRAYEVRSRQPLRNNKDWFNDFISYDSFAANEAMFRAPDAPARWFGAIENPDLRARVLAAWVGAFDVEPVVPSPYVRVHGSGSRSSS